MDKTAYICTGSCQAKVSQEQYDSGIVACQAKDCTKHGQPFEKVERCENCICEDTPSEKPTK